MSMNLGSLPQNKAPFDSDLLAKFWLHENACQRSEQFRQKWRVLSWRGSWESRVGPRTVVKTGRSFHSNAGELSHAPLWANTSLPVASELQSTVSKPFGHCWAARVSLRWLEVARPALAEVKKGRRKRHSGGGKEKKKKKRKKKKEEGCHVAWAEGRRW